MKKRLLSYIVFAWAAVAGVQAQNLLTAEAAVEIALKNNFDISIARNTATIANVNNNIGNAGMLPNVSLNVSENIANNNISQKFSNGLEVQSTAVGSNNLNANVTLDWTLFDGMRMFASKRRLEELQQQSGFNLKEQVQQTVAQVMTQYFGLVGQKMQIRATEKSLEFVQKRYEIINAKYTVGVVSAFELNQVKIDQNTYKANLLLQQNELKNMQMDFNVLLGRGAEVDFSVPDTIVNDTLIQMPAVETGIAGKNFSLLSAQKNISILQQQQREIAAQRLPLVRLVTSYGYTRQTSEAGFSLLNQNNGLNVGFTASMPLFRSISIRNQVRTAELQVNNSVLFYDKLQSTVDAAYRRAYNDYQAYLTIVSMEEANARLAFDNYTIAQGRLEQGLSTLLEVKDADRNWQDAQTRHIAAKYNLKLAEIGMKQLTGQLVSY